MSTTATMPGSALLRLRSGFVRAFEEALPERGGSAGDLCDVAEEALSLPDQVRRTWEALRQRGLTGEPDIWEQLGKSLRAYIEGALHVVRALGAALSQDGAGTAHGDLPGRLENAVRELESLRDAIFARWPKLDRPRPQLDRDMVIESRKHAHQAGFGSAADIPR